MKKVLLVLLITAIGSIGHAQVSSTLIAEGFTQPVDIANDGFSNNIYIVEKRGIIKYFDKANPTDIKTLINLTSVVSNNASEKGLLGLAFHPSYSTNGYFFVNYTTASNTTVIARYQANNGVGNINTAKTIYTVTQPFSNHNAGDLVFGKDGLLYIPMGDGGSAGDPGNRAQNPLNSLGKMLRIDINTESAPYLIPPTNPYRNNSAFLPEILSLGLRNPWRVAVDRLTGDIFIGDVGQNSTEEISLVSRDTKGGENFGWRCLEGNKNYNTSGCQPASTYVAPIFEYPQNSANGCSITGGFVYRGTKSPSLEGKYIYGDYCVGQIWALSKSTTNSWTSAPILKTGRSELSTFGEDREGEIYYANLNQGTIFLISSTSTSTEDMISSQDWNISPNPVSSVLNINLISQSRGNIELSIMDLTGKVLIKKNYTTTKTLSIDISSLTKGIYIVAFKQGTSIATKRFVKE